MRNTILILGLSMVFFSCTKNNNGSPGLKLKSVNTTVLQQNAFINFDLSFTDANGDLDMDTLFVIKISQSCPVFYDTLPIPYFPTFEKQSGDFVVSYGNGQEPYIPSCSTSVNDTCYFRFVARDMSGKMSDTVQSPTIIVVHQ